MVLKAIEMGEKVMGKTWTKVFAVAACLALGVSVLTGCGGGSGSQTASGSSADAANVDDRVFNYGVTAYSGAQANGGIDPHMSYAGWSTVRYGVGECLVKISQEGTIEPWVAENWTIVDDNTWEINIKDNVTFSNGKKVDAAAVKACFERLLANNERAASGLKIASMEADGQKLTVRTSEKNPILINWLTDPFACIIDVTEEVNGNSHIIGTGPYLLDSATTDKVVVKANHAYWNGTPKFGTVNIQCFLDGDTMAMAMQNGELDACANLGYSTLPLFENNSSYTIHSTATSRSYMFTFNTQSGPFSDANVRKAVTMAINKEGFVNTLMHGFGQAAQLCYPASYEFGDSKVTGPAYDQAQAKQLLADAGWTDTDGDGYLDKNGEIFEISWVTYRNRIELPLLAESAQASLREIGIKVNIDDRESNNVIEDVPKDFDISSWALVTAPYTDGITFFNEFLTNYGIHGWSGAEHDAFMELYNTAAQETDSAKRAQYSVQLQQMLIDNSVLCVVSHNTMNIVTKSGVTGLAPHPSDYYEITADLDMA